MMRRSARLSISTNQLNGKQEMRLTGVPSGITFKCEFESKDEALKQYQNLQSVLLDMGQLLWGDHDS